MHRCLPFRLLFFAILFISSAQANSISDVVKQADLAMEKQDWAKAKILLDKIINSGRCRTNYQSSVYGPIYFKYGTCQLKQKKWKEAAASFEKCYKKSPSKEKDINPYQILSLRYWAEAEYHLGNHQQSSKLFMKHFREKPSI